MLDIDGESIVSAISSCSFLDRLCNILSIILVERVCMKNEILQLPNRLVA